MACKSEPRTIEWPQLFEEIPNLKAGEKTKLSIRREIIPIIFVPGIMGSRLKKRENGQKVWDPDSNFFMLRNYGLITVSAGERKRLLIGNFFSSSRLVPDEADASHNERFEKEFPGASARGWGGVRWASYGPILEALQRREWPEPIRHCFEFPVYAFGYNWTASCDESGAKLAELIEKLTAIDRCEVVILVTHSMGGLVARSACVLHGAARKVLGVIHGVQPATGAPAAYWRMKAGFERPGGGPTGTVTDWLRNPVKMAGHVVGGHAAAWTLGSDGEEVTALLGNMPGGLELLPTSSYRDNAGSAQWLEYVSASEETVTLPRAHPSKRGVDPYKDIYLEEDKFYRLIDKKWLEPEKHSASDREQAWKDYADYLKAAREFHERLKDGIHPRTYQFYSDGITTADRIVWSGAPHGWRTKATRMMANLKAALPGKAVTTGGGALIRVMRGGAAFTPQGLALTAGATVAGEVVKDSDWYVARGGCREYTDAYDNVIDEDLKGHPEIVIDQTLEPGKGSGDGTVPSSSGSALKTQTLESVALGAKEADWFDRQHEPVYKTEIGQHIAMVGIENFCRERIKEKAGRKIA